MTSEYPILTLVLILFYWLVYRVTDILFLGNWQFCTIAQKKHIALVYTSTTFIWLIVTKINATRFTFADKKQRFGVLPWAPFTELESGRPLEERSKEERRGKLSVDALQLDAMHTK